jgi:hypothetical protein
MINSVPSTRSVSHYHPLLSLLHSLHSYCSENLKSYIVLTGWALYRRRNVSPVMYKLDFYIPEDDILHSDRRENLRSYFIQS